VTHVFTSRHELLSEVVVEIDWENPCDSRDPLDWVWGEIRAYVCGEQVELSGTGLGALLDAYHEREGDGALGFRDEMVRQLEDARTIRLEERAEARLEAWPC
jgi:hypothetical protein